MAGFADLGWARSMLVEADMAADPGHRRRAGLLAARQAAMALLGQRAQPRPLTDPVELWALLAARLPVFAEWASYFMLFEGARRPTERQVDDLLRDLPVFLAMAESHLTRRAGQVPHAR